MVRASGRSSGCRDVPSAVPGVSINNSGLFGEQSGYPVPDLAARILAVPGIDGVTFSGGEPFAQAGALADWEPSSGTPGLSVVTFTGYSAEELFASRRESWRRLIRVTDLLIAGPYMQELACADPLIASSNQQVIPLSGRIPADSGNRDRTTAEVEFSISPDGTLTTTGFPDRTLASVIASLGQEE